MAGQHARHGCWLWPPSTEESPAVRRRVLDCSHRGPPLGGSLRTAREGKEEVETQAVPWFPGRLRRPLSRPLLGGGPQNAGLRDVPGRPSGSRPSPAGNGLLQGTTGPIPPGLRPPERGWMGGPRPSVNGRCLPSPAPGGAPARPALPAGQY